MAKSLLQNCPIKDDTVGASMKYLKIMALVVLPRPEAAISSGHYLPIRHRSFDDGQVQWWAAHSQGALLSSWLTILRSLSQSTAAEWTLDSLFSISRFPSKLVSGVKLNSRVQVTSGIWARDSGDCKVLNNCYTERDKCHVSQSSVVARDNPSSFSNIQSMCKRNYASQRICEAWL